MADGGGRDLSGCELPEELLYLRVQSEVSFPQYADHSSTHWHFYLWHIQAATINWVKKHTTIPVAEVYGYDARPNNEVGGAYILQERVCDREQFVFRS